MERAGIERVDYATIADPETLALHFSKAGAIDRAAEHAVIAADRPGIWKMPDARRIVEVCPASQATIRTAFAIR